MNPIVSPARLAGGVVRLMAGMNATDSFGSDVSRVLTGSPTNQAFGMLLGGIAAASVSLGLTRRSWKHT